jgi:alpha-D-xyloside xylohydrolase
MPYLYSAAGETHKTGVPTMRAMLLEFDEIPCEDLDRQYMLGERLLVAPVFSETGDVTYYLPEGEWTHLLSNKVIHGGHWLCENYDFFSLPLFVRENTLLPMGKDCKKTVYDYTEDLTLHLFSLKDKAETTVYRADGTLGLTARATRTDDQITVTIDGSYKNLRLCLRNVLAVEDLHGATAAAGDQGLILSVESNTVTFRLQ